MRRYTLARMVIAAALSLAAMALAACAPTPSTTATTAATPPVTKPSPAATGLGADRSRPGSSGTITQIEGATITVDNPQGQTRVTVMASTSIQKTVAAAAADLKVGQTVSVAGSTEASGDVVATRISLRQQNAGQEGFAPASGTGPNPGSRTGRPGDNGGAGLGRGGVLGTIAAVSANSLTLTTIQSQSVTVRITPETALDKVVSGSLSDLKVGDFVLVAGTAAQNGNIEAVSITAGSAGPGFLP